MDNNDSIEKEILESRGVSNVDENTVEMVVARGKKTDYITRVDKLKTNRIRNRKRILMLLGILILVSSFAVGGSYAYVNHISSTDNVASLEAGIMKLNFKGKDNALNFDNAVPQLDGEALKNNKEYKFTITNTGNVPAKYMLTIDNNCTESQSYTIGGNTVKPDMCIPDKYIKVALKINDRDYKILTRGESSDFYALDEGVLKPGIVNQYSLKLWLDYDTPNTYNSKGKLNVVYSGELNILYEQVSNFEQ